MPKTPEEQEAQRKNTINTMSLFVKAYAARTQQAAPLVITQKPPGGSPGTGDSLDTNAGAVPQAPTPK